MTLVQPFGEPLDEVRRLIAADFEGTPDYPGLELTTYRAWTHDAVGAPSAEDSAPSDLDDPVCVSGGRSFPVSLRGGMSQALVTVADALVDDVMDRLNRPWPTVVLPDGAAVVLEPQVDEHGQAVWTSSDGTVRCPVGHLQLSFGSVGALR